MRRTSNSWVCTRGNERHRRTASTVQNLTEGAELRDTPDTDCQVGDAAESSNRRANTTRPHSEPLAADTFGRCQAGRFGFAAQFVAHALFDARADIGINI